MKKIMWVLFPVLFLLLLAGAALLFFQSEEEISREEVVDMLEGRYQGEVETIERQDNRFAVTMNTGSGVYQVLVEAESGEVASFEQVSAAEEQNDSQEPEEPEYISLEEVRAITAETVSEEADVLTIELMDEEGGALYIVDFALDNQSGRLELDAVTGNVQLYTLEDEEPAEPLSEEEAVEIALGEFQGEVDDIDLEEKDGRLVFEIEIENESADREADITIDAYTGEVLSVELDD